MYYKPYEFLRGHKKKQSWLWRPEYSSPDRQACHPFSWIDHFYLQPLFRFCVLYYRSDTGSGMCRFIQAPGCD